MKDLKSKTVRGAAWSAIESWTGQGMSFLVFLVLARILGPADFGLIALASVYVTLVQMVVRQGLAEAIIQLEHLEDAHLDTAFWTNLAISVVFAAFTMLCAGPVATLLGSAALAPIIRWLSVLFILGAFTAVQQAVMNRALAFKTLALRTMISFGVSGAVGVGMALAGCGVWSLVGQQISNALVNAIALWTASAWHPRLRFSRRHFRELWRFGLNIFGMNLLDVANKRSDQYLVGLNLGAVILGYYSVASRVYQLMLTLGVASLSRVAAGAFSRLQSHPAQLAAAFGKSVTFTTSLAFPAFLGFAALAPEIMRLCFGPQWLPAVLPMQILMLTGPLHSLQFFHGQILRAMGKPHWQFRVLALHTVINITLYLLLVRHGLIAMISGYVVSFYLVHPVELWLTRRLIPLPLVHYFGLLWPQFVSALAMVGGILTLKTTIAGNWPPALLLSSGVLAGTLVYVGCMALLRPAQLREFCALAQNFGAKRTA